MKQNVSADRAFTNAMVSVRMEGLSVSPYACELLKKLLNKEVSREEYIWAILDYRTQKEPPLEESKGR